MLFVFALLFLSCAVQSQRGTLTFPAIIALIFSIFFLVCAFALYRPIQQKNDSQADERVLKVALYHTNTYSWLLKLAVLFHLVLFAWDYRPMWFVAVLIGCAVLLDKPKFGFMPQNENISPVFSHWLRKRPWFVLTLYALVCLTYITTDTFFYKNIDVYHFQHDGVRALLQGTNPYTLRPLSIYPPNTSFYAPELVKDGVLQFGYPYLPLTLLMAVPGVLLGDVRFALFASMGLAGWLLMRTGDSARPCSRSENMDTPSPRTSSTRCSQIAVLSGSLLLLFPHFLYFLVNAWNDVLVVMFFCLVVLCAVRKSPWLPVAVGLWLASKQYVVLLLPLIVLLLPMQSPPNEKKRFYLGAIGTALIVSLPMILWNVREFAWSALQLQFYQPLRDEALSLLVAVKLSTGVILPMWIPFIALIGATVWALRIAPRTVHGFCASCTLVFFVFIALNKQAFLNYYFVVFAMLCCTLATFCNDASPSESDSEQA